MNFFHNVASLKFYFKNKICALVLVLRILYRPISPFWQSNLLKMKQLLQIERHILITNKEPKYGFDQQWWRGMADVLIVRSSSEQAKNEQNSCFYETE